MGVNQLLIILLIIILLFGAKKIPELARGLGKGIKTFKDEMDTDQKKLDSQIKPDENEEASFTQAAKKPEDKEGNEK